MDILSPDFLTGSFVFVLVGYGIALIFQLYMAYLNWKQSKVNNQMDELLAEVKKIRKQLDKKSKK